MVMPLIIVMIVVQFRVPKMKALGIIDLKLNETKAKKGWAHIQGSQIIDVEIIGLVHPLSLTERGPHTQYFFSAGTN